MTEPDGHPADDRAWRHHPANPVGLITGLMYVAIGVAVLVDDQWGTVDLGVMAATGAVIAGAAAIVLLVRTRSR